jgi:hypothetical protein
MATGTFGTAINCMDGRVQTPIADWVKMHFSVTWVDMITEAGADGILAHGPAPLIESMRQRAHISVEAHGSSVIVVAGHDGCAGNPVSREQHLADIRQALRVVAEWGFSARVVGLFVNEWGLIEEVPAA